ncbi:MAG: type II toxin-antitoxin system VapB family antitoxin [Elusimicrobiota bacterium]
MRTTLNLPEGLLSEARRLSGARTKTQAIIWGLEELTRKRKVEKLWRLRGKLSLSLDLPKSRKR